MQKQDRRSIFLAGFAIEDVQFIQANILVVYWMLLRDIGCLLSFSYFLNWVIRCGVAFARLDQGDLGSYGRGCHGELWQALPILSGFGPSLRIGSKRLRGRELRIGSVAPSRG